MTIDDPYVEAAWYHVRGHGGQVCARLLPGTAGELAELSGPWLTVVPTAAPDAGARVLSGLCQACPAGYEPFEEVELSGGVRTLRVHARGRSIWIPPGPDRWHVLQVLRSVRNLLRWQALEEGGACLHGALVARDGRGVVVLGAKKAGKTSTVLAALAAGFDFVSNDDVTLLRQVDCWLGVGWPRSVNVRIDAAEALGAADERISRLQGASTHPRMERLTQGTTTFSIYPRDLCHALNATMLASVKVVGLLLVSFGDLERSRTTRLTPDEARARLPEYIDRIATDHDTYLESWFGRLRESRVAATAEALASELPCYERRHHLDTVGSTVELLGQLTSGVLDGSRQ